MGDKLSAKPTTMVRRQTYNTYSSDQPNNKYENAISVENQQQYGLQYGEKRGTESYNNVATPNTMVAERNIYPTSCGVITEGNYFYKEIEKNSEGSFELLPSAILFPLAVVLFIL